MQAQVTRLDHQARTALQRGSARDQARGALSNWAREFPGAPGVAQVCRAGAPKRAAAPEPDLRLAPPSLAVSQARAAAQCRVITPHRLCRRRSVCICPSRRGPGLWRCFPRLKVDRSRRSNKTETYKRAACPGELLKAPGSGAQAAHFFYPVTLGAARRTNYTRRGAAGPRSRAHCGRKRRADQNCNNPPPRAG